MKKTLIIILFNVISTFTYCQNKFFYWYQGEKTYLNENMSKRFVLLKNIENEDALSKYVGNAWHVEKLEKEYTL